jgi:excisionase family DNA binding protein
MSEYVSVTEAAVLAGVSERTVRRWVTRGRLRAARRGQALMIATSELADVAGRDGGQADGHGAGVADMSASEAGHLAALVRELQADLANATATIGLWQGRAEVLALQLEDARAQLALSAPTGAPESHVGGRETAPPAGVPQESVPKPAPRWWRRWWAALAGT